MPKPADTITPDGDTMPEFTTCESAAAVMLHARRIGICPITLSGHIPPLPITLCGTEAIWDTRLPLAAVRCRKCVEKLSQKEGLT